MTQLINALTAETTPQELFDYITAFLLKQNARSLAKTGSCQYRGSANRMCAVGCILPDAFYSPTMEGASANVLLRVSVERVAVARGKREAYKQWADVARKFANLLSTLQAIHDGCRVDIFKDEEERRGYWADQFKVIAQQYHLTFKPDLWKSL